ncbi:hypothetical protein [Streptomyces sp. NPDC015414]|uniref:hypothetical protein n=1 Tax=Streptomyces sp. NPDC015414 TaxID=3364957 RepID=UPI0036F6F84B
MRAHAVGRPGDRRPSDSGAGLRAHPASVDRVVPARGPADVSDGKVECIAQALRVHSSFVDMLRQEAIVVESCTTGD